MLVKFGNNWIQKIPRTAKLDSAVIWQSEEFFSSDYFQIGQHVVLLHILIMVVFDVWTIVNFEPSLTCNILLLFSRPGPGGMNREYEQNNHESGMFETTFGVDGEVETYTNEKPVSLFITDCINYSC